MKWFGRAACAAALLVGFACLPGSSVRSDDKTSQDPKLERARETVKMLDGYHQGCDPTSAWGKDPAGSKLQHDVMKSLLDPRPPDACIACDQLDCTGARQIS